MSLDFVKHLALGRTDEAVSSPSMLRAHLARSETRANTVERAALAGHAADGLGWAFAGGYQAALTRIDPAATRGGALAALCATEEGGGHPRAIRTLLQPRPGGGWTLTGTKTVATLGADADVLLVVASTGEDALGRNRLRVVRVASKRDGVAFRPGPALPFAPEIAHAHATFDAVTVDEDEVVPGDGYDAVLKPFRTVEDVHVMAAILGWSIRVAHDNAWKRACIEEAVALIVCLRALDGESPTGAETHLALAGAMASARDFLESAPWQSADPSTRARWERDRALLGVASSVRAARLEAAWRSVSP